MDRDVKVLYTILVYISGITVIFAPFGLIFSSLCLRTVHINLRFLIFILGLMWCIIPIGGLYFYFILGVDVSPPLLYQKLDYQIAKNICAISGYAFRVIETAICIERLLATIYFETYEKKRIFQFYFLIATLVSILISVSFSVLFNILHVPAAVIYIFLVTVETTNFILLYMLKKQNHKLRQLSNSNRALLTSKYQLIENIKSLNLLFPHATISFVMSSTTIIVTVTLREFYKEGVSPPIFYTIYGLNIIMVSVYWVTRSPWYKIKIYQLRKFYSNQISNSTEVATFKATTVKTALGHNVKVQQTVEDYFKDLKRVWK